MKTADLLEAHKALCEKGRAIMANKNADYANPEKTGDPFKNFRVCEALGIATAEEGVVIRLTDKLSRISSLLVKEAAVKDESFEDTVVDAINYLVILSELRKERKSETTPRS